MNIAIDMSPLSTGNFLSHRVRGTGFYLTNLKNALEEYFPENTYYSFSRGEKPPKNVDIVHIPYFEPFFSTLPAHYSHRTVVTVHDLTPFVFPKEFPTGIRGKIIWFLQKHRLKKTNAIITDSQSSKIDINRFTGINNKKIHVVYLAPGDEFKHIEISKKEASRIQRKYNLPKVFALYVGDATWNKNIPNLIKASRKANVPLVLTGKALVDPIKSPGNPWNKDLVEAQAMSYGQEGIVRVGFVPTEDLVLLYNMATVFIMPSYYEGFGLPLVEAMSCGTPIITTNEGSIQEVVGGAAEFVDPRNVASIGNTLKNLVENENLRKKMSKEGRERVKIFSWKKTAIDTMRVYHSIMS